MENHYFKCLHTIRDWLTNLQKLQYQIYCILLFVRSFRFANAKCETFHAPHTRPFTSSAHYTCGCGCCCCYFISFHFSFALTHWVYTESQFTFFLCFFLRSLVSLTRYLFSFLLFFSLFSLSLTLSLSLCVCVLLIFATVCISKANIKKTDGDDDETVCIRYDMCSYNVNCIL